MKKYCITVFFWLIHWYKGLAFTTIFMITVGTRLSGGSFIGTLETRLLRRSIVSLAPTIEKPRDDVNQLRWHSGDRGWLDRPIKHFPIRFDQTSPDCNLILLYCWHRYSNRGCVFWSSDYNWINMIELIILLVAVAKFIVRLPIINFWFDQFHLQYFDCCVQHAALFRDILYHKYNYKFPNYNRMAKTSEQFLSVSLWKDWGEFCLEVGA